MPAVPAGRGREGEGQVLAAEGRDGGGDVLSATIQTGEQGSTEAGAAGVAGVAPAAPGEVSAGYAWRERPILMSAPMVRAILEGRKTQTRRLVGKLWATTRRKIMSEMPVEVGTPILALPGRYPATLNQHGAVSVMVGGTMLGVKPGEFDLACPYAEGQTRLVDYGGGRKGWAIVPSSATASRLWVRETWVAGSEYDDLSPTGFAEVPVEYFADGIPRRLAGKVRVSIHMPRWASRLTLEVTEVRVQRLQDITEDDARAEGVKVCPNMNGRPGNLGFVWPDSSYDKSGLCHSSPVTAFAEGWELINGERAAWSANPWVWVVAFRRLTP
jgi:hypothetical protein